MGVVNIVEKTMVRMTIISKGFSKVQKKPRIDR